MNTLNTRIKSGSRKGRRNYDVALKKRLAIAACEPGISVARLALDHGINANMLHKWRRAHLAAAGASLEPQLLPVRITGTDNALLQSPAYAPLRTPDRVLQKLPVAKPGVIEIRMGTAILHIQGAADAATLAQVLRHLHP